MGFDRHLLVDGANMLHAWPEGRTLAQRHRDAARATALRPGDLAVWVQRAANTREWRKP